MIPIAFRWDTEDRKASFRWNGLFSTGIERDEVFFVLLGFRMRIPWNRGRGGKGIEGRLNWIDLRNAIRFLRRWKLKKIEATFSLADPMVNGCLYGWLSAFGHWDEGDRVRVWINFIGERRLSGEAILPPKVFLSEAGRWIFPLLWKKAKGRLGGR